MMGKLLTVFGLGHHGGLMVIRVMTVGGKVPGNEGGICLTLRF